MWDPYAEFESATLPNGLTVYASYWPKRPVSFGVLVYSGAREDKVGLEGTAHFVEHLVSRNAPLTYSDIRAFFKEYGGNVDLGGTSLQATRYKFLMPADPSVLKRAFELFGSMLLEAKLENAVEIQRQVIIQEFHRKYDEPWSVDLAWRVKKTLFGNVWPARFIASLGTPETVDLIAQSDLQEFYDTHYAPQNMSVVCVGGMSLSELVQVLLQTPFGKEKVGTRTPLLEPDSDFQAPSERQYVFEYSKYAKTEKPLEQGAFESAAIIPGRIDPLILRITGEMLDKILFDEIREKRGWTYSIGTSRGKFRQFTTFSISCSALPPGVLKQIPEVMSNCIDSVASRRDLFEEVTRSIHASLGVTDQNLQGIRDNVINDLIEEQEIETYAMFDERLLSITMEDVQLALKWLAPGRRWSLIKAP